MGPAAAEQAAALGPEAAGWALAQVPAGVQAGHAVLAVAQGAAVAQAGVQSAEDGLAVAPPAPARCEQVISVAKCECSIGSRDMTQSCCKGFPVQLPAATTQIEGGQSINDPDHKGPALYVCCKLCTFRQLIRRQSQAKPA